MIRFLFCPVHPGELLKDELDLPYTAFNEILNGKRPVTTDFAMILEAALGVSPNLLLRMQIDYNLQVAQSDSTLKSRLDQIRKIAAALSSQ